MNWKEYIYVAEFIDFVAKFGKLVCLSDILTFELKNIYMTGTYRENYIERFLQSVISVLETYNPCSSSDHLMINFGCQANQN